MPEGARIYSTDALSIFRAALIKFAEMGNVALSSSDSDIDRVLGWLERDQTSYWAMQVRKRHAIVLEWEDAVRQKRLYKNVDGTSKSAVDEQKALQKAKPRRGRGDRKNRQSEKMRSVQLLRKESMMFKGRVQRLATSLQSDIPQAIHSLDNMLTHIDAYLQVQTAGEGISLGRFSRDHFARPPPAKKSGLKKLRDRHAIARGSAGRPNSRWLRRIIRCGSRGKPAFCRTGRRRRWAIYPSIGNSRIDPESRVVLCRRGLAKHAYLSRAIVPHK